MSTLYRNYRPEKFVDILGQNHIKVSLQNEIATDTLSQAYLFAGPRAVGKTTLARVLAKAVNCLKRKTGNYEPCGQCQACLSIKRGNNLEVVEIDAASNTGVDNVRDNIIAFARLSPSQANYKVFIIDEVHMLSLSAFNALLKIIEEPPKQVIFILCTTEVHKVPGTIVSRCQRFDFKRIISSEVVKKLKMIVAQEKFSVDQEVLMAIAKESGGHLRDAESLLGQILSLGEKSINLETAELVLPRSRSLEALDFLNSLARKDTGQALETINQLVEGGVDLKNFNEEIVFMLRKLLLNFAQPGLAEKLGLDFGEEIELKIIALGKIMPPPLALKVLRRILTALYEKNYLLPQLPLEMAAIELCFNLEAKASSLLSTTSKLNDPDPVVNKKDLNSNQKENEKTGRVKAGVANINCQKVEELWPEFLMKIKKYNHSLSFILQNCSPGDLKSGQLNLEFKYKFHYDRALNPEIKPIIEKTLSEVFGSQVAILANLNEKMVIVDQINNQEKNKRLEDKEEKSQANNLLKTFGGQIVS